MPSMICSVFVITGLLPPGISTMSFERLWIIKKIPPRFEVIDFHLSKNTTNLTDCFPSGFAFTKRNLQNSASFGNIELHAYMFKTFARNLRGSYAQRRFVDYADTLQMVYSFFQYELSNALYIAAKLKRQKAERKYLTALYNQWLVAVRSFDINVQKPVLMYRPPLYY